MAGRLVNAGERHEFILNPRYASCEREPSGHERPRLHTLHHARDLPVVTRMQRKLRCVCSLRKRQ